MVANAGQTSAADRATLQQLRDLWSDLSKQKQALNRQERIEQIQRLLRQMGLDDPERFARRLPLLRSMGLTEAEWKPLQVMIEERAFASLPHPGLTAAQPVITDSVISHMLHPEPQSAKKFTSGGIYGGHQTANLRQFIIDHPEYEVVQVRSVSSEKTTYREFQQYRWNSTTSHPPPIGDPTRPGGAGFGPNQQVMWSVAGVPKTTADNLQAFLSDAEAAWEAWRSTSPNATSTAAKAQFTTPPNAAGVAFEGGFNFNSGPPPSWTLNTIYPKL
jgi:hypothetical protein